MADEADRSVVLVPLHDPFLASVMTKEWVQGIGHSPVCQIVLQIVARAVITSSPPTWSSSVGMLSPPADFMDKSSFPMFHSGQVFHGLVCPLPVVLLQIIFNLTTLFSYPVFFCLFHAPLDAKVHFPVFLRSFRFESFLFQFSPFVALLKNF